MTYLTPVGRIEYGIRGVPRSNAWPVAPRMLCSLGDNPDDLAMRTVSPERHVLCDRALANTFEDAIEMAEVTGYAH